MAAVSDPCASSSSEWLHDIWTMYFHDPSDNRWTLESYKRLCDISTIDDFWKMHLAHGPLVPMGMFFVMRENVFPCWDDSNNLQGGTASMKVASADVSVCWETILKCLLGETLAKSAKDSESINGVSISPKRGFCIVKIWTRDNRFMDNVREHLNLPAAYTGEIIYRKNTDNIQNEATKLSAAAHHT